MVPAGNKAERLLSVNHTAKKTIQDSIKAKKVIKDHMLSNGLQPHTTHISNQLIQPVATARQKYQTFLEK